MNENILYRDDEKFRETSVWINGEANISPPVVVTDGRITVGTDSYSLHGVISAKLNVFLRPMDTRSWRSKTFFRWAWVFAICGALGFAGNHFVLLLLLPAAASAIYANMLSERERIQRVWVANLILERSDKQVAIPLCTYHLDPNNSVIYAMKQARIYNEKKVEFWKQNYDANIQRPTSITEAVGLAIGKKG